MHRLLERQLRKAFHKRVLSRDGQLLPDVDPELVQFVDMVQAAYAAEEEDRAQFERSLHLASEELFDRNRRLETELLERARLEIELRVGEKLRAVGQLAAGIAHEINTPIQFVGDSLHFLEEAFREICILLSAYEEAVAALPTASRSELTASAVALAENSDFSYLKDAVPKAIVRCTGGVERVAIIVRALKNMAHPDATEQEQADLNAAIENTLVVCASQVKYVADVELDLSARSRVLCHMGEIQQVLLNLIVNAAQAIGEHSGEGGRRGTIRIGTREEGNDCVITIADNGAGIPEAIRDRMFEPFFTTKPVGKGTGQGLYISRSLVVERHGGKLTFDSSVGEGTTFTIRLPIAGRPHLSLQPERQASR